jgi:hypothetical protein
MDEKLFSRPVRIHIAGLGTFRHVSNVHEALDCLIYGWPTEHNSRNTRAIETCLNVMAKGAHANEAEAAFNDAADEAGLLLRGPNLAEFHNICYATLTGALTLDQP